MTGPTQSMKKKEEKEDFAQFINKLLNDVDKARKGFTPEVVGQFYEEGARANQRRETQKREELLKEATPSRQFPNIVIKKKEEQKTIVSPLMTQHAIEAAVDLGERLELAAQGRKLNLQEWISR